MIIMASHDSSRAWATIRSISWVANIRHSSAMSPIRARRTPTRVAAPSTAASAIDAAMTPTNSPSACSGSTSRRNPGAPRPAILQA